jgi:hypothetical protein
MPHMTTIAIIALAKSHLGRGVMDTSAELCLTDALCWEEAGRLDLARERAIKSLAYSVGVFHPSYLRAVAV